MSNKQLAEELHKPVIRDIQRRKARSSFINNIWDGYLTNMHLIGRFKKGFNFLLCVIDIYSKYAQVIPLKDLKKQYNY